MRELVVNAFVTLDGVMQAPGGPEEDPSGGFAHGGGSVNYWDDVMNQKMGASMGEPFDLPLGRKTYEIFAAHWPHVSDEEREARGGNASDIDDPATAALNEARKYVASTTLGEVTWNNSTLLRGDVAERVAALKAGGGPDIQVRAGRRDRLRLVRLRGADRRGSGPPPQPRRRVMPRGHGRAV